MPEINLFSLQVWQIEEEQCESEGKDMKAGRPGSNLSFPI